MTNSSPIDSSMININKNSSPSKDINTVNICRIIQQNSCEICDDLLEIQQIEYEQRLILEEINRIDAEKQRLQDLLNLLQSTNVNTKRLSTKPYHRRLQRINSNSDGE